MSYLINKQINLLYLTFRTIRAQNLKLTKVNMTLTSKYQTDLNPHNLMKLTRKIAIKMASIRSKRQVFGAFAPPVFDCQMYIAAIAQRSPLNKLLPIMTPNDFGNHPTIRSQLIISLLIFCTIVV